MAATRTVTAAGPAFSTMHRRDSASYGYVKEEKHDVDMDADVDHNGGVTADFIAFTEEDDGTDE